MDNKTKIAVIGMGYVGLPLALEFSKFFQTTGFDINKTRIENLKKNIDENNEFQKIYLKKFRKIRYSNLINDIINANVYIICLPTPLYKNMKPNLVAVKSTIKTISKFIKPDDMIILESTVYPGVCEEICIPIVEKYSNLTLITDTNKKGFLFGYSPERVNPGDKVNTLKKIKKIVSSNSTLGLSKISYLYSKIITAGIYKIKNIKLAESSKVIENVQRDVNIALINEFANIFANENFSIYDLIEASSTKWNFMKFYPGLVGGHCIGVDPYYLSYWAKLKNKSPRIILAGRETNDNMFNNVVKKIKTISKNKKISLNNCKMLIMGYTFKENCSDIRNTQVNKLFSSFLNMTSQIDIFDPRANKDKLDNKIKKYFVNFPKKNYYDVIIIAVNHNDFKKIGYQNIKKFSKLKSFIFDLKNCFNNKELFYL